MTTQENLHCIAFSVILTGLLLLLQVAPVSALTIYSYTGTPFTDFRTADPRNPFFDPNNLATDYYTPGAAVSGYFTTDAPLEANSTYSINLQQSGQNSSPIQSYNFTDGILDFTNEYIDAGCTYSRFMLVTDASANIIAWTILLDRWIPHGTDYWEMCLSTGSYGDGSSVIPWAYSNLYDASSHNTPGTWTSAEVQPVPEPSSLLLISFGIAGLWGRGRKYFKSI